MAKKSHLTKTKVKLETEKPFVMGEYYCLKEMQPRPVTMSFLRMMAEKLNEWSLQEDALHINQFFRLAGISKKAFYSYIKRCPELEEAHENAFDTMGARREMGAITKKYDTGAVWKRQFQFGQEYKEATEFAAKLAKKEEDEPGGTKIVVIEKMVTDPSMEKYFKTDKKSNNE